MHRHRHLVGRGVVWLLLVWPLRLFVWVLVFSGVLAYELADTVVWAIRETNRRRGGWTDRPRSP